MSDGRNERGEHTKQLIYEAGRRMFARCGYAGTSVRNIATDAAVNAALIRYHYGCKEGLWNAVIDGASDAADVTDARLIQWAHLEGTHSFPAGVIVAAAATSAKHGIELTG